MVRRFQIGDGLEISSFLPLALTTMLIITIVKSSIALSLGLVGALSIVRFRAAIKDPEELTYLFLVIGLGLATGANQFLVAFVAIPAILFLLWVNQRMSGKKPMSGSGSMYVNIETDTDDLQGITAILSETLGFVELKRMDSLELAASKVSASGSVTRSTSPVFVRLIVNTTCSPRTAGRFVGLVTTLLSVNPTVCTS